MADRVEAVVLEKVGYLAKNPGAGHGRKDLTAAQVRFFPGVFVFDRLPTREASAGSCLDFHGRRDVAMVLKERR